MSLIDISGDNDEYNSFFDTWDKRGMLNINASSIDYINKEAYFIKISIIQFGCVVRSSSWLLGSYEDLIGAISVITGEFALGGYKIVVEAVSAEGNVILSNYSWCLNVYNDGEWQRELMEFTGVSQDKFIGLVNKDYNFKSVQVREIKRAIK